MFAGNDYNAKAKISQLIRCLGFTPVDRGSLQKSRKIEDIPVKRFPNWKYPLIISFIVFLWFFLIGFGKFEVCFTLAEPPEYKNITTWEWLEFWKNFKALPLYQLNTFLAQHALTMLALCYLPGCIGKSNF